MDLGLGDAAVLVTGGTQGMGRAIAETFAADGARVAVLARRPDELEAVTARLRELGAPDAVGIPTDVADQAQVEAAFTRVGERWGALNALVNTVGPTAAVFDDLTDEGWQAAFDLGTLSAVRCVRAGLPLLRAAGWARIVNISAHSVQRQSPRLVAYTAAKAALTSLTKNLSRSLGPDGILVNTVSPGTIITASFTDRLRPVLEADGLDPADPVDVMTWVDRTFHHPADLGRAGLPEDIASITVFLASRRNAYITGANVNVDGGSDFI